MGVITTGNFVKLLTPGIRKLFGDEYKRFPKIYPQYMKVTKSGKKCGSLVRNQ